MMLRKQTSSFKVIFVKDKKLSHSLHNEPFKYHNPQIIMQFLAMNFYFPYNNYAYCNTL